MKARYFVRRLAVAPVIVFGTACAWFMLNAALIAFGAEPNDTAEGVWQIGLTLGGVVAVLLLTTNYKKGN